MLAELKRATLGGAPLYLCNGAACNGVPRVHNCYVVFGHLSAVLAAIVVGMRLTECNHRQSARGCASAPLGSTVIMAQEQSAATLTRLVKNTMALPAWLGIADPRLGSAVADGDHWLKLLAMCPGATQEVWRLLLKTSHATVSMTTTS